MRGENGGRRGEISARVVVSADYTHTHTHTDTHTHTQTQTQTHTHTHTHSYICKTSARAAAVSATTSSFVSFTADVSTAATFWTIAPRTTVLDSESDLVAFSTLRTPVCVCVCVCVGVNIYIYIYEPVPLLEKDINLDALATLRTPPTTKARQGRETIQFSLDSLVYFTSDHREARRGRKTLQDAAASLARRASHHDLLGSSRRENSRGRTEG